MEGTQFWQGRTLPEDSRFDSENEHEIYAFLSKNTILNTSLSGECKLVLPYNVTTFDYIEHLSNESARIVLYLATDYGKIIRVLIESNEYKILSVMSLSKLVATTNSSELISELLINEAKHLLYVTTQDSVYQLDLKNLTEAICGNYMTCTQCFNDPSCEWDAENSNCSILQLSSIRQHCVHNPKEFFTHLFVNLTANINDTVILNCIDAKRQLMFDVNWFMNKIKWFKNNETFGDSSNARVSNLGELILLNVSPKDVAIYTCQVDLFNQQTIFNLTMSQAVSDSLDYEANQIINLFEDWKKEVEIYKLKQNEFERCLNFSES